MKLPTIPALSIDAAKVKPIRCKGQRCNSHIIGFAHEDKLLISNSWSSQDVRITGDIDFRLTAGKRRSHAKAVRFLARRNEDEAVMLLIDPKDFEDSRVEFLNEWDLHFVFGFTRKAGGRAISIMCDRCKMTRKIHGMELLISTALVDILLDRMVFKG